MRRFTEPSNQLLLLPIYSVTPSGKKAATDLPKSLSHILSGGLSRIRRLLSERDSVPVNWLSQALALLPRDAGAP